MSTPPLRRKKVSRTSIPRVIMYRIAQEVTRARSSSRLILSNKAIDALHAASEAYMEEIFTKTTLLPEAKRRPTLQLPCMQAVVLLCP